MKNIYILLIFMVLSCETKEKQQVTTTVETETKTNNDTIVLTQEQLQLMHVSLGKPEQRTLQGSITAHGKVTILANNMADITALFKGRVEKIRAHEGQFVNKGEVLIEIIAPDMITLQEDYLKAKSELHFLTQELERQRIMAKENIGASKNLQEIESKVFYQNTLLKSAEARLKLANIHPPHYDAEFETKIYIKAPISGYLDHFPIALGTTVTDGMKVAHIKSFDDPHVDIAIFEKDLQLIKTGQTVHIKFTDPSVPEATGHIEYIGRDVDPTSKTVTLHVPFKTPNGKIVATDMSVLATIETQNTTAWALPESAVVLDEGKYFCFLLEKNKDKSLIFNKIELLPKGNSQGWVGIDMDLKDKTFVTKGANILLGESKRAEMSEE